MVSDEFRALNQIIDAIGSLREEQRHTNELLTELLQSNWALIEALGDSDSQVDGERQIENSIDLEGNQREVAATLAHTLDLP